MARSTQFESALRAWAGVFMRRSVRSFIMAMKDSGLSSSQLNTLMRLHYHGSCPVSAIGDELGVTAAAATQIADRLAGMGLIERAEDPADRRVRRIRLTDPGRKLVRRGLEARIAWARELAAELPERDLDQIVDALHRLTEAAGRLDTESHGLAEPSRSKA